MKKYYELVTHGSAEWVVLRALYRKGRGRRPVDHFGVDLNPLEGLRAARQELSRLPSFFKTARPCTMQDLQILHGLLGLRPLHVDAISSRKEVVSFFSWGMEIQIEK